MPNLFTLIGQSWDFARKQPTALQSAFWFLFLPGLAGNLLADYQLSHQDFLRGRPEFLLLIILCQILLALILLWGTACVLNIGKRLLQAKSGRTRTSLSIVNAQTRTVFIPLLLTGILRSILTLLRSILLIILIILLYILRPFPFTDNLWNFMVIPFGILAAIPGIIYFFRTAFYPVIVVCEGVFYRPALRQCIETSRGQLGSITLSIIGLSLLTLFPAELIASLLGYMAQDIGIGALIAADIASSLLFALAFTLYLFGLVGAYDYFRPKGHVRN